MNLLCTRVIFLWKDKLKGTQNAGIPCYGGIFEQNEFSKLIFILHNFRQCYNQEELEKADR